MKFWYLHFCLFYAGLKSKNRHFWPKLGFFSISMRCKIQNFELLKISRIQILDNLIGIIYTQFGLISMHNLILLCTSIVFPKIQVENMALFLYIGISLWICNTTQLWPAIILWKINIFWFCKKILKDKSQNKDIYKYWNFDLGPPPDPLSHT